MTTQTVDASICEGCHGSGRNSNCEGDHPDDVCRCEWHTGCLACQECGGCGTYDCACDDTSCHDAHCDQHPYDD